MDMVYRALREVVAGVLVECEEGGSDVARHWMEEVR